MRSVYYFEGQIYLLKPIHLEGKYIPGTYEGQCLRCLWPASSNTGSVQRGVLGPVPGVMGSMQALEAIKFILDLPTQLDEYNLLVDLSKTAITKVKCFRNPHCPVCSSSVLANADNQARLVSV